MFLDRRFSAHCWDKRKPTETHVPHEKKFDGNHTIQKHVQRRVQHRSGCTAQTVARFTAHSSHGHTMECAWQDAHTEHPHETSRKTSAQPWVAWRQVSRFDTMGNRVSSERLHRNKINKSNISTMGQIQEGRLAAGEVSLQRATPRMHCCER